MFPRGALIFSLFLLLAAGCSKDADKDGFSDKDGEDCDDYNAAINPDADEYCDGVDNDCDGTIDESDAVDATIWYADLDGDGFGDVNSVVFGCSKPDNAVADNTDCDDENADTHPGAAEYCDEEDNDCNGKIDDNPEDPSTWYADVDGDGYGSASYVTEACSQPSGYTDNADDCDDTEENSFPGNPEICDGLDNDCNDLIDDGSLDPVSWYPDADGDGYGDPNPDGIVVICTPEEGYVDNGDDCDDTNTYVNPAAYEFCDEIDNNCDGDIDEDSALDAKVWYLDADADGFGEITETNITYSCSLPEGYSSVATDCDDTNNLVYPRADELCDEIDNDCDEQIDESAVDASEWFLDYDGDGYGDGMSIFACSAPVSYVANADDCNDLDATSYPGGTEVCDGDDNDCDGTADNNATDADTWYIDSDSDGYGSSSATTTSCTQPSGYASAPDDCDDSNSDVSPAVDEICADGIDNNCDGDIDEDSAVDAPTWYYDGDGDGYGGSVVTKVSCSAPTNYVDNSDDCNDLHDDAYPGHDELCDYIDNNCDGVVDEDSAVDAPTWYYDGDGDSFGDTSVSTVTCFQPTGYEKDDGDCDDTNSSINPDADEYCDGVDNNCDGATDEDSAVDVFAWYQDLDSDNYGNAANVKFACIQPSGYGPVYGDCNDTDSSINPGADEYCDSVDNNCDGVVDENTSVDAVDWFFDDDNDGYGDPSTIHTACTEPAGYVDAGDDCDDANDEVNPGVSEVCNDSIDNNCDGIFESCELYLQDSDIVIYGDSVNDFTGGSVTNAGDINNDGVDDLLIGGEYVDWDPSTPDVGCAYLFYGPLTPGTYRASEADGVYYGEAANNQSASVVQGGFDLNGDYNDDFLVAGKKNNPGPGTATGAAYMFYGPVSGGTSTLASADVKFTGVNAWDFAGIFVNSAGDVDGDMVDDILVAASNDDDNGPNTGTVFLVYGGLPSGTTLSLTNANMAFEGEYDGDSAGQISGMGDVDGDGLADMMIGVVNQDSNGTDAGSAYLIYGATASSMVLSDADVIFYGTTTGDRVGSSIAPAGDVNSDGLDDMLISATRVDDTANNAGATYVVYGSVAPGSYSIAPLADVIIYGSEASDAFGSLVKGNYDFNSDGELDYLISANGVDTSAGASYLFLGPLSGTVYASDADAVLIGEDAEDSAGAIDFGGNFAGSSSYDTLLVGADGNDSGAGDAGAVYVIFGIDE